MKIVPAILGQTEIADARIYGFPPNMLCGIIFENEDEARQYKELLEDLLVKKQDE